MHLRVIDDELRLMVDEARTNLYLGRAMLRRLLACLAIITGLAAAGTPAHASVVELIGATVEQSRSADEPAKTEAEICAARQRLQRERGQKVTPCPTATPVKIYIPSVYLGSDRAFE